MSAQPLASPNLSADTLPAFLAAHAPGIARFPEVAQLWAKAEAAGTLPQVKRRLLWLESHYAALTYALDTDWMDEAALWGKLLAEAHCLHELDDNVLLMRWLAGAEADDAAAYRRQFADLLAKRRDALKPHQATCPYCQIAGQAADAVLGGNA